MTNLKFDKTETYFGSVDVAVSGTTGFTYEVHNKWDLPRGVGFAVFVRDCATGKTTTGNKAAFYTKDLDSGSAKLFCENHNSQMNAA
tara:strand:- start:74 stop:334 length:261 start_codon:yes stop_codon:yes gene_type:complete